MEQLRKAIGVLPRLAICTDACKGLEGAVMEVFPWVEQMECFRHLMENMKKQFTGDVYAANMWPAARAYAPVNTTISWIRCLVAVLELAHGFKSITNCFGPDQSSLLTSNVITLTTIWLSHGMHG